MQNNNIKSATATLPCALEITTSTDQSARIDLSERFSASANCYGHRVESGWIGHVHDKHHGHAVIATSGGHETASEALAGAQAELEALRDELLALFPVGGAVAS